MAKQFLWPNPPVTIDTTGLATEAKQDAQIVIANDTLTELQDFHADNTAENAALDSSIDAVNTSVGTVNTSIGTVNTSIGTTNTTLAGIDTEITDLAAKSASSLVSEAHDYLSLTYVPSGNGVGEIQTVVYKDGGAGGTTVATLTLAYDSNNKLVTVTRS